MASGGDRDASDAELRAGFETLVITRDAPGPFRGVYEVRINRPAQRNALSPVAFAEIPRAMSLLDCAPSARAVVLSAAVPHFCAGIELGGPGDPLSAASASADPVAAAEGLRRMVLDMQAALTAIERCQKLVVAAVHGACIDDDGDLVAACDIRCCSRDASFVLKEVDMAIVADLGALQRLPRIVGYGNAADLALTGRKITAMKAKEMGLLVTRVFDSKQDLDAGVTRGGVGTRSARRGGGKPEGAVCFGDAGRVFEP
ncbi:delta(3,5)-Delta(2,4)-dienoyl-CoA isomerase, peroxisomal-like [Zea mays]|uniref:delta(3,5)-Delta(2,4)-dienoyl-CoA isomerase, peroxisomal-like n=1 Tax=Zea mays TaxID=4577 RepID=UPI0009A951A7|nr:delta(3,5)-Delta(2,4)-dienoyl-CoA isomerase, peroxisomal-like [Zea mays]|eukprot:XP_020407484.1 delta(3,5)-Delta(2,4)-dienoyl-CoA isomerase, peroxisomal-like [Zea mays]